MCCPGRNTKKNRNGHTLYRPDPEILLPSLIFLTIHMEIVGFLCWRGDRGSARSSALPKEQGFNLRSVCSFLYIQETGELEKHKTVLGRRESWPFWGESIGAECFRVLEERGCLGW